MVYVGKNGPDGGAFSADGEARPLDPDGEALRHAEELFRRGYVFEDSGSDGEPAAERGGEAVPVSESAARQGLAQSPPSQSQSPQSQSARSAQSPRSPQSPSAPAAARGSERGLISELLGRITTEEILIGAIILILALNGTDDGLLLMLVILLFC